MLKKNPSKHSKVVVVQHRPYQRFLYFFVFFLALLSVMCGSFYLGRYYAVKAEGNVVAELELLKANHAEKIEELEKLDLQLAHLKLVTEVDSKANEEVRAVIVQLRGRVAALKKDNIFYRSVMYPASENKGVVIDQLSIFAGSTPNLYKYKFVIKQIVAQHRLLSGYIQVELLGKQDGELRRLALSELSETIERIQLKFKYFQRIEGEILLPDGFSPERIVLEAVIQRPKQFVVDKEFDWLIKES